MQLVLDSITLFVAVASSATTMSILNGLTKHFSNYRGTVRVLLYISEMCSFVASLDFKGRPLKLPLQNKKPNAPDAFIETPEPEPKSGPKKITDAIEAIRADVKEVNEIIAEKKNES